LEETAAFRPQSFHGIMELMDYLKRFFVFIVIFLWSLNRLGINSFRILPEIRQAKAASADLVVTSCDVNDTANTDCLSAISADGGTSYALGKGNHIDAPFQALSAQSINSATLYYDSWGSLSGSWGIYVKDSRDGTTICSVDPAPQDGSETTNSTGCSLTTTQLSNGIWLQVDNNDDKGPDDINLDYVRFCVDYTPAPVISVSVSDGLVEYGKLALDSEKDTTSSGLNDTQTATNDGNGTENFNIKTSNATGGTAWTVGTTADPDVYVHSFSTNGGSSWEVLDTVDVYETLATGVAASGSQDFDLKIHLPTETTDYQEKTVTVTVQATESN